jgi:hypothetical protein
MQLTSSHHIDVNEKFDLVPNESSGTRRAVLVGINYIGHEQGVLSGCHNDGTFKVENGGFATERLHSNSWTEFVGKH